MANKHQAIKQLPAWTAWAYITYHRPIYVFLFMKINIFTCSGVRRVRSRFTVSPAAEKTRSDGTEVAGVHRLHCANLASLGYLSALFFHQSVGFESRGGGWALR